MGKRNVGIILSYFYYALNIVLTIFISSFIIRSVGKTDYGVHQSMTSFLSYLVLLEFGTGTIMTRNLLLLKRDGTDETAVRKCISTIWTMTIVLLLIIVAISIIFYFLIGVIYSNSMNEDQIILGKKIFIFSVGNTLFSFLVTTFNGVAIAYEKYLIEKIVSISRIIIRTALLVLLLSLKQNILFVSIVDFSISLLTVAIMFFFCKLKLKTSFSFKYFDKKVFVSSMPLAVAMLIQTIVNTANGNVDKFCISVMMTPEDVSVYSVSMSMFTMFSSIATIPLTMFMPAVAKNVKAGLSGKELTRTLVEPCRVNVVITGLVATGFLVVGIPFLVIVYGVDYSESWIYAIIVIVPMFFNMSNSIIINVLDILNKRHVRSYVLLFTTLLNILLTIFGIYLFGMIAAAIATAFSLVLQTIILNIYYSKKIGISIMFLFWHSYKGIVPCLVIAGVSSFFVSLLIQNDILKFLVCGFSLVLIFFLLLILFGLTKEEKQRIKSTFFKIFTKKHITD